MFASWVPTPLCQAPVVGDWVTLGHGTASVASGERTRSVNVPMDPDLPDVAWLRVSVPACLALMITEIEVFTTSECKTLRLTPRIGLGFRA